MMREIKMSNAFQNIVDQGLGAIAPLALGALLFVASAAWAEAGKDDSKTLPEVEQLENKGLGVGEEAGSQEMVCRPVRVTGSRKRQQTCHTRADWAAMRRNAGDTVRTTQQQPTMHFENEGQGARTVVPGGGG